MQSVVFNQLHQLPNHPPPPLSFFPPSPRELPLILPIPIPFLPLPVLVVLTVSVPLPSLLPPLLLSLPHLLSLASSHRSRSASVVSAQAPSDERETDSTVERSRLAERPRKRREEVDEGARREERGGGEVKLSVVEA
jgi:hypothetical protein